MGPCLFPSKLKATDVSRAMGSGSVQELWRNNTDVVATEIVLQRIPHDFNSLHLQKRRHPVSIFSVDLNTEMCGLCVRSPLKVRASASDRNYCLDALDLPPSWVLYPSHTQAIVIPWSAYQASQSKNTAALTEPPPEYLRVYYSIPCLGFRASAPGMN